MHSSWAKEIIYFSQFWRLSRLHVWRCVTHRWCLVTLTKPGEKVEGLWSFCYESKSITHDDGTMMIQPQYQWFCLLVLLHWCFCKHLNSVSENVYIQTISLLVGRWKPQGLRRANTNTLRRKQIRPAQAAELLQSEKWGKEKESHKIRNILIYKLNF